MRVEDTINLSQNTQQETLNTPNLEEYQRFLAYTHNDGPDDVALPQETSFAGVRKLKGTFVWTLLWPARMAFHYSRYAYQVGVKGLSKKINHAIRNNRWIRRKQAKAYLDAIWPTEEEVKQQQQADIGCNALFSVLVPLYNTPEKYLRDMIESVIHQTYENWELILADASDRIQQQVHQIVEEYADKDPRIVYHRLARNLGIAENTNACMDLATGEYLALFDHDDMFHPSALYEVAKKIGETNAQFVYTDEATFDGDTLDNILTYHFKPDYSVDNLRGVNYICHLSVFHRDLIQKVGKFQPEYDGSQDHDLIMRLTDAATVVAHVPKILYFWRSHDNSTSKNIGSKSYAIAAGRKAVHDAEVRRGYPATVYSAQICKTHYRLAYEIKHPLITIILDKGNADLGIETTYDHCEWFVAQTNEKLQEVLAEAKGEYLVFLEAGVRPITTNWVEELLMFAQREDVALVGGQVVNEKGILCSSDVIFGTQMHQIGLQANIGDRYDAPGYMGRNYYAHNVSAVAPGVVMIRRKNVEQVIKEGFVCTSVMGQFMEISLTLANKNQTSILNPYVLFYTKEKTNQLALNKDDQIKIYENYLEQIKQKDPYYNPNLSLEAFWQKKERSHHE